VSLPPFELPPGMRAPEGDRHPADAYQEAWRLLEESAPLEAIELLDPAVAAEPMSTGLRTLRAWAYFKSAQLGRAEADLTRIVELDPSDVWARFALGRVLERQSRYADALPHLRLAAVMSGDAEHEHEAGVLRVERRLAERQGTLDELS
jgi:tetratricopeptide (TPR) repeat protein